MSVDKLSEGFLQLWAWITFDKICNSSKYNYKFKINQSQI